MFAEPYTRWVAPATNCSMLSGVFTDDMSFSLCTDIRWAAVWDDTAAVSHGALFQFFGGRAPNGSAGFKNSFWNRKYDHKLYLRIDPPRVVGEPVATRLVDGTVFARLEVGIKQPRKPRT